MRLVSSFAIAVVAILSGCGGGSSDDAKHSSYANYTCSMFRYQEEAQAAYAAGATQLDRDKDGKACEELPSRPYVSPTNVWKPVFGVYAGTSDDGKTIEGIITTDGKSTLRYVTAGGTQGVLFTTVAELQPNYKYTATLADYSPNSRTDFSVTGTFSDMVPGVFFKTNPPYGSNLTYQNPLNIVVPTSGGRSGTMTILSGTQRAQVQEPVTVAYSPVKFTTPDRTGATINGKTNTGCMFSGYIENTKFTALTIFTFENSAACKLPGERYIGNFFMSNVVTAKLGQSPALTAILQSTNGITLMLEMQP